MKARSIVLVVGIAALAVPGAQAGVTTTTSATQYASFQYDHFDPETNVHGFGGFYIFSQSGLATNGTTPSAISDAKATAILWSCDYDLGDCGPAVTYGLQTVGATALTMHPIGNEVQINACLLPTGGGGCHNFVLQMTRPSALSHYVCVPCGPNVWWDDDAASASTFASAGIARWGYLISGTFAGAPLTVPQSTFMDSNAGTALGNAGVALIP